MRSGMVTLATVVVLLAVLATGWHAHILGKFGQLKTELNPPPAPKIVVRPGGADVMKLERSHLVGDDVPEFLSATLLPGRGMNMLQIRAYLPQKGEINLLASPSLEEANRSMTGTDVDANGEASLTMGSAIEIPWAGKLWGSPANDGIMAASWQGMHVTVPTAQRTSADGGLLLNTAVSTISSNVMPDGGEAEATFRAGDFAGHWPSNTVVTTSVELSGRAIEMKIIARNTGQTPEPMGIGWAPRFAIPEGHRGQMTLRLPQGVRAEIRDRATGQPSGKLVPIEAPYDFTRPGGVPLGTLDLNESFTDLRQGLLDSGVVVELRDPMDGFGLRITALTPEMKVMKVVAPAGESYISIQPRFNFDDPFGRQWAAGEGSGMVVLQPGQSAQWRVRLEIFSLDSGQNATPL